uniref:Uncharacterized protein n=2 Tax=Corethron hystrix TaxID=216773 RepID=A0A7S1FNM1_9STRA|mmetsp:Transcript_16516/g.37118  ORF Transcript_16516/g.37118 Transcript_16516/m.37118 type:complete len:131 (+) Transcript_16516:547-939(+)
MVPCGIFDDKAIVEELRQCIETIRKAMVQIAELHPKIASDPLALNQATRWISTKDEHAQKIITIVGDYCLCQRVKPAVFKSEKDYVECLKAHHALMQAAMRAKQGVDVIKCCGDLDHTAGDWAKMYLPEE